MIRRLTTLTALAALLVFSTAPSFADHHGGGHGVGGGGTVETGIMLALAGMAVAVTGTAATGMAAVAAGIMVVTAAAGELAPP